LWTVPAGVTLSSRTIAKPTFTAPEVTADKTYTFTLVVNDGTASSTADEVIVTVKQVNKAPVANAGTDQEPWIIYPETQINVTLNGSASYDSDNNNLTYHWTAPEGVVLSSNSEVNPSFIATINNAVPFSFYTFLLVVNDGLQDSPVDQVLIYARQVFPANEPSVSKAGPDQVVNESSLVTLDGSGSYDPDEDAIIYKWMAPVGITLSSTNAAKPTFIAPEVNVDTEYTFSLIVNDGADSQSDLVVITVKQVNKIPVANAGADQSVNEGATVTLDGSLSSDADGTAVTYLWTAPAGVTLSSPSVAKPTFTAPEVTADKTYTFTLVVNDGTVNSTSSLVVVWVKHVPPILIMDSKMNNAVIPVADLSYQLFKKSGTSFIEKKITPEVGGDLARFIVEQGEWIVLVSHSKSTSVFTPTYTGNVMNWANAEIISIPENGTISKTIDCLTPETTNTGTGEISGNVYEKQGTGTKSISVIQVRTGTETPINGALVHLYKRGGAFPVSSRFTDVSGSYKFEKLPIADYEIVVELPGFTQSEKLPVALSENTSSVSISFAVNTTTQSITSNNSLLTSPLNIYPNPVSGPVTIDLGENAIEPSWLTIYSIQGNVIMQQELNEQKTVVDLSRLVAGSYLVKVSLGKEIHTKVLIKK
ncbi:MAG: PKD domain-containing protein, partial [Bacteroidota bacterium]|nr:PKD domain-containing protein [Bacteroidota bacterium]